MNLEDIQDIYPLSPMQQGMLFHSLYLPESEAYFEQFACKLTALNSTAFVHAWERVVQRHTILRTAFIWDEGDEPVQIVCREVDLPWQLLDWRGSSPAEQQAEFENFLLSDRMQSFALTDAPLMRLALIAISDGTYYFVWSRHHLLMDGWSAALILKEVSDLYEADCRHDNLELPEPRPYRDYIAWLQQQDVSKAESFWRDMLKGFTAATDLRLRIPEENLTQLPSFDERRLQLPEAIMAALLAKARKHHLTLSTLLQGAWALLLSRYSAEEDVAFGIVASGRQGGLAGIESMVGLFINTLPVRVRLRDDLPQALWLEQLQGQNLELQQYEYSRLAEVQSWSDVPGGQPLFESILVVENFPVHGTLTKPGAKLRISEPQSFGLTNYPLSVVAMPDRGLLLGINYDCTRYDAASIDRMLGHLRNLLENLLAEPDQPGSTLPMLSEAEHHQLLVEWNKTGRDYPDNKCIHHLFEEQVERAPEAIASVFEDRQITYGELNRRANKIAHLLIKLGVRPGAIVGICIDRSLDLIPCMLGVLKAGAAYLPLDTAYPQERLTFIIRDAKAAILLTNQRLSITLAGLAERVICLDSDDNSIAQQSEKNPFRQASPDQLAYVIYTSGSTGLPKGVCIPHRALVNHSASFAAKYELRQSDCVLQFGPTSFDISVEEIFPSLLAGATVVIHPDPALASIPEFLQFSAREKLTVVNLTTPYWHELVSELQRYNLSLPSTVRLVIAGSDRALPERLTAWQSLAQGGVRWMNAYGLTESTVTATIFEPASDKGYSLMSSVPIGRPIWNIQAYVLDERLRPVPIGIPGELYLAGAGLTWGYINRHDLTAERLLPNPFAVEAGKRFFRTGDSAYYLPDGNLAFESRLDDQVKVRGFRVELKEIESVLLGHPGVEAAAVLAEKVAPGENSIIAFVVPDKQATPPASEMRSFLKDSLPDYMIPSAFVILDALPLLPNGKLDRRALPSGEGSRTALDSHFVAPSNDIERTIAGVWQEVLRLDKVGLHDNFFDLGGHSLLMIQANSRLREVLNRSITMVEMFQYPTVSALARYLSLDQTSEPSQQPLTPFNPRKSSAGRATGDIAIIGMAGRFPGADNIEEFWENLQNNTESITLFSEQEIESSGVPREIISQPNYVKAGAALKGIELFDASFFGFSPREAEIMDPQQRLFLEAAWQALEDAGYDPTSFDGRIGLFAGAGMSSYLINNLLTNRDLINSVGRFQTVIGNDRDHLTTLVSYKLNLRGPSFTVQTACSTSLVAVHIACQSLLNFESEIAMAGGVAISVPQTTGYSYSPGGILSPDGHCRAFDSDSQGTVSGNGLGLVVLKRLSDALSDGDSIRAIIKGSALNNDGAFKVGYTAPGLDGQASVISDALAAADIDPASISYVEAHGTATPLGDPIEVAALNKVFAARSARKRLCAIGSVKTNIGHLDAAAGVAGLIKTVLALEHKMLPASLHFKQPNPGINFDEGPFYVNAALSAWDSPAPRRAGVSSFGIGGTNAHVILEEAPDLEPSSETAGPRLLMLSARTAAALDHATSNFVDHLKRHPRLSLPDAAYTLADGRKHFSHRRMAVCDSVDDAIRVFESLDPERVRSALEEHAERRAVFMFPGQGSQYLNMGMNLYKRDAYFRSQVDTCCQMLKPHMELDLRELLYAPAAQDRRAEQKLNQTHITQPAIFVIEYSLARLLMKWGVQPEAMIGHSVGEYVAACLSGVFSLQDALRLVAVRGKLIQRLAVGAMLSVAQAEDDLRQALDDRLSVAAVNAPGLCTVSGPVQAVQDFEQELIRRGITCKRLRTSHAFHSSMMEPAQEAFIEQVRRVRLSRPQIPYISNVTGTWMRDADAVDSCYWGEHLPRTVRYSEGLAELMKEDGRVYVEVGPGKGLSSVVRQHRNRGAGVKVVTTMRAAGEEVPDEEKLIRSLGELWLSGVAVKWAEVYKGEGNRRVKLPTYPFERHRYWVEPRRQPQAATEDRADIDTTTAVELNGEPVAPQHARPDLHSTFVAPVTQIEKTIATIWQELLGIKSVGLHDNFFEMGGHSLLMTQLVTRLREAFPVELPLRDMFEQPTIAGLATVIEEILIEMIEELPEDEAERLS